MADKTYLSSADELLRLRDAFAAFDEGNTGRISKGDIEKALRFAGRDVTSTVIPSDVGDYIEFDVFLKIAASALGPIISLSSAPLIETADGSMPGSPRGVPLPPADIDAPLPQSEDEGPDPKVQEFIRVLDEYRIKCEAEGSYDEAAKATDQLATVRKQEELRRIKAMRSRHEKEKGDILAAHDRQYTEFTAAWDRYLAEFDAMASMYIAQMQERHAIRYKEFQDGLHKEILARPVKYSRELLEWRGREQTLAKQRKYADAQRIKVLADELERRERRKLEEERLGVANVKESQLREKQTQELSALVKRIEARRSEHVKQREVDSKRLLQRNRNVVAVLDQRQFQELQKHVSSLKAELHPLKQVSPKTVSAGLAAMKLENDASRPTASLKSPVRNATSPRTAAAVSSKLGIGSPGATPAHKLAASPLRAMSTRPVSSGITPRK